ncbi:hypothetical protein ACGFMM_34345 [Streptomyces sp. NPDC048604]|uniref:hypothetical protein n=1 Tax=Streptomyces sp. NPDC048604 TaxID=3365578 RepID=UPI0037174D1A
MNTAEVGRAFGHVQQMLSRTPCRECRGTNTVGYIIEGAVIVSCEDCGGATRKGRLAARDGLTDH